MIRILLETLPYISAFALTQVSLNKPPQAARQKSILTGRVELEMHDRCFTAKYLIRNEGAWATRPQRRVLDNGVAIGLVHLTASFKRSYQHANVIGGSAESYPTSNFQDVILPFKRAPNSVRTYLRRVNEPEEQRVERWNYAKLLGFVAMVGVAVGIALSAQFSVVVWAIQWLIS